MYILLLLPWVMWAPKHLGLLWFPPVKEKMNISNNLILTTKIWPIRICRVCLYYSVAWISWGEHIFPFWTAAHMNSIAYQLIYGYEAFKCLIGNIFCCHYITLIQKLHTKRFPWKQFLNQIIFNVVSFLHMNKYLNWDV